MWNHSRATTLPANTTYTYTVSNSSITAVTTDTLNDASAYVVSTVLYDAMMRPRQTQTSTPQGGRMVTDVFYDSRGWKSSTYNGWWDSATGPNTTLVSAASLKDDVPSEDYYTYDGLGRVVVDQSEKDGAVVSATTTVYNGDRTTVIPPAGATPKATLTDPLGRTIELDSYTTAPTVSTPTNTSTGLWSVSGGSTQAITYGYDNRGNQDSTASDGQTWSTTTNILGQVVSKTDPTAGTSTMAYNAAGQLASTTDALSKTISYTYDALGRQTASYDAAVTSQSASNQLTANSYDGTGITGITDAVGQLTTETSYSGGLAYIVQSKGFNVFGESMGENVTVPASTAVGALAGTYTFQNYYSTGIGLPLKTVYAAAGGLPAETVASSYTGALDLPSGIGGTNTYANTTSYDAYSRVQQETLGSGTNEAFVTDTYDPHTSALTDQLVTRTTATPTDVDEQHYTYDLSGNITTQVSTRLGATTATETQCYQYDGLDRLNQAWTATDSCAATPTTGNSSTVGDQLAGGTAYWSSWTFDALGNRQTETDHSTTGGTDTTTGYTYANASQPDTLTSTSTTGATTSTSSYAYDADGNTTTRTTPAAGTQTLTWNDAGQLTEISGGTAGTTDYVYGPDGSVLLQEDPGTTTLYLPGEQLALNTGSGTGAGTISGTRTYAMPGGGIAERTGSTASGSTSTYTFQITDLHGTSGLMLDSTAQNPTWRQFTPYGATRGATVSWTDNHGFLNAPTNTDTGLTVLGARQYDPVTGRFISLDPLFEATDSQQLNGYTYSGDDPINMSDPTGLCGNGVSAAGCQNGSDYGGDPAPPGGGTPDDNGTGVNSTAPGGDPSLANNGTQPYDSDPTAPGWSSRHSNYFQNATEALEWANFWANQNAKRVLANNQLAAEAAQANAASATPWYESAWDSVSSTASSAWDTVSPYLNAQTIEGAGETVLGAFLVSVSTGIDVGAGALCLTGVGCLAGAPALAGSLALGATGLAMMGDGSQRLAGGIETANSQAGVPPQNGPVPQNAQDTIDHIDANGGIGPSNYGLPKWQGKINPFRNKEGFLPSVDGQGNPISYSEYDVNPFTPGVNRGGERLVLGSDGSGYFTDDHYRNFIQMR